MSVSGVSDERKKHLIEREDYEECQFCGERIGEVKGLKACSSCHTTPAGNFISDWSGEDFTFSNWPYEKCEQDDDREEYESYSVKMGRKRVRLNGGYEEAYRDPSNGIEYCISEYQEHEHHDGLVLWHM